MYLILHQIKPLWSLILFEMFVFALSLVSGVTVVAVCLSRRSESARGGILSVIQVVLCLNNKTFRPQHGGSVVTKQIICSVSLFYQVVNPQNW